MLYCHGFFFFLLYYVTKKGEVHQEGMNLNGAHQHLFYGWWCWNTGRKQKHNEQSATEPFVASADVRLIVHGNNVTLCMWM